ncbi:MAG: hypothetical protein IJ779_05130 [Ruminococcus sp.]|nr:hypothetical protein [Ruminococcus sp.]
MKMKLTALLLASLLGMAGAVSCGKVSSVDESSVELKLGTTTAVTDASGETTTTEAVTTTDGGETTTTAEGETTTAADEAGAETTAANAAATEAPAAAATEAPTEAPAQQQEQPQQNNDTPAETPNEPDKKDVQFSTDLLLQNAAETIAALGNPVSTSTAASCTTNGCDVKIYNYPDMEVQCYIDGGVEYLYSIKITGGDYKTSKGIKVGSSRADVEAAYGAGEEMSGMIIYSDGNKEMDITYSGDTVSSIDFYTPV